MPHPQATAIPALELTDINKRFGPVHANKNVTLAIAQGSIHGLVGENGAGKSTLMSILYGFYQADSGTLKIKGKPAFVRSSKDAIALGIGMVFQHFMLVETLSVVDNILLGAEGGALLGSGAQDVRAALARFHQDFGLLIDPDALVGSLSVGLQQRIEILKALYRGADILILDEPTAVLTPPETEQLFRLLESLKAAGKTVVLITHKLREIMAITDQVSIMRQGAVVATLATQNTSPAQLADLMVGRKVLLDVQKSPRIAGECLLEMENVSVVDGAGVPRLQQISLTLHRGEILGVAGVSGNGQSELLAVLAGLAPCVQGAIRLYGKPITAMDYTPKKLREQGLMHIPEDRHKQGLVTTFCEYESAMLGYQDDADLSGWGGWLSPVKARARALQQMTAYDIRPPDPDLKTAKFSGGNQQKIILAREIKRAPKIILVGQPTRGVDIGAIEAIHKRLIALRDAGVGVLLVSAELDEIMSLSDRIIVMCNGRITGTRLPHKTNEQDLGLLMAGVDEQTALQNIP